MKYHHQSIIRNGNHFIRLNQYFHFLYQDRWFLIDGPWFEYLEKMGHGIIPLRPYQKMSMVPIYEECGPSMSSSETIVWEQSTISYLAFGKVFYNVHPHILSNMADKYENVYFDHRVNALHKKMTLTVWECNGGILPAWIKNPEWDEHLEELFSLTTYNKEKILW